MAAKKKSNSNTTSQQDISGLTRVRGEECLASNASRIRLDGTEYEFSKLNNEAKAILASLQFSENRLRELSNELAVAQTAQIAYLKALKSELPLSSDQ